MPIVLGFDENWGDHLQIPLGRNGKYGMLDVELERLPQPVLQYVFEYGMRQVLNDAMAEKTDENGEALSTEAIVAKAEKRLEALYAGTLRTRRAGDAETLDPFEAEFHKLVRHHVTETMRAVGHFKGLPKGTKDRMMFVINTGRAKSGKAEVTFAEYAAWYATTPHGGKLQKEAERNLKARDEIDVDQLMGG